MADESSIPTDDEPTAPDGAAASDDVGAGDAAELQRLRKENAELERQLAAVGSTAGSATVPAGPRHRGRWFASWVLIVVGSLLVPVSVVSLWLDRTITDTDRYVETVAPLIRDPDIQKAVEMLSQIVAEKQIPSKILILHQFETEMIYNKDAIKPLPGVDIVLDMDGFGSPDAKLGNYDHFVTQELIEYGGIKLFYRQDDPLLTPEQIVALDPPALVVIYQ